MGKLMREISVKISSNDGMYTTCMTSVTTFSQKREYMQNFSQGKKWKFINVPSSLDVQRLKKLQVPKSFQDEPNPLPQFLKAKEGIDYVTSKGTKSQLHSFNQSYEPSCLQTQLLALAPLWILCPQFFLLGPIWVFLVPRDLQKKQGDVCIPI